MSEGGSQLGPVLGPGMGARFVRGVVYLSSANWLTYALNFVLAIAIARLLGPAEFGIYAFCAAINEFVNMVGGFAVGSALIQAREESQERYDTAYAMAFATGLLGLVISLGVAAVLAATRSREAAAFLVILALLRIVKLQTAIPEARMERRLRYGAMAAVAVATRNLPGLVGLGMAWQGFGAWSLIGRDALFAVLPFVLIHALAGYRFRRRVTWRAVRQILSFSGPMFVARALDIAIMRLDRLLVGSWLGELAVGLYDRARYLAEAPALAMRPVNQLAFNLYARVPEDPGRMERSYELLNFFLVRLMLGLALGLLIYPAEVIRLLLGPEWLGAVPVLRVLGVYAACYPLHGNLQQLIFARGWPMTNVRLRVMELLIQAPGMAVALALGSLEGVALVVVASTLVALVLAAWISRSVVAPVARSLFAAPAAAGAATVAAFALLARTDWLAPLPYWTLPALPPIAFVLATAALDRRKLLEELRYLRGQLGRAGPKSGETGDGRALP